MSKLTASQQETLAVFTSGAAKLEKIVAGLSEKELDCSTVPGEWTIRRRRVHRVCRGPVGIYQENHLLPDKRPPRLLCRHGYRCGLQTNCNRRAALKKLLKLVELALKAAASI